MARDQASRARRALVFLLSACGFLAGPAVQAATAGCAAASPPLADRGDGSYDNPVLAGDYSDPDVVRVGRWFYMVSSSFANAPGLPILRSPDLVNWTIIGHALPTVPPGDHYRTPRRGGGVWAPAIRHHGGRFLIYYPDPDFGIFVITAADPAGSWSKPRRVLADKGAIDPAPFWDDDGKAWLVHAWAGSRAGFNNIITLVPLGSDGLSATGKGRTIIDGRTAPPVRTSIGMRPWQTTEGPKLYKRDGWYYVFAPSGSVKGGWQGVFRSRRIAGPYEGRDVLDQGPTAINGPHQGAWVTTASGEDWFLHFQDTDSYGRRVFVEPMRWRDGWPLIGMDPDGDGIGQPVLRHRKPSATSAVVRQAPQADDAFKGRLGLGWQWNANPSADWASLLPGGGLRLTAASSPANLWEAGNLLSQKLPAERFCAVTRMHFSPLRDGERAGLALFGSDYAWIGAERRDGRNRIVQIRRLDADRDGAAGIVEGPALPDGDVWLRFSAVPITVSNPPPDFTPWWPSMLRSTHVRAQFSYSLDGKAWRDLGDSFVSKPGRWVGAQIALFAQAPSGTPSYTATTTGHADFAWFKVADLAPE